MKNSKPKVTLLGTDGNAFVVMAMCHRAWRNAGNLESEWAKIQYKMVCGDYDHLLHVVMEYFEVL
jgi:hypothetical protein